MPTIHSLISGRDETFVLPPPLNTCEVCVVIPARDESLRIEKCLLALVDQTDSHRVPISSSRYEIIVLANNCRDATASLAREVGRRHPQLALHVVEIELPAEKSFVGGARKILMDEACRRLYLIKRPNGIIASTDGDTVVESTWLSSIIDEVDAGADAVSGRIVADRGERMLLRPFAQRTYLRLVAYDFLIAELEHLIDPDLIDPFPRHSNHLGASMAVTATTYAQIGGLPDVREDEDSALYRAILLSGARFRHSLKVRATTSARLDGRVECGFSTGLKQFCKLDQNSASLLVESVSASETRLRARRILRSMWHEVTPERPLIDDQVKSLARLLQVSHSWLSSEIRRSRPWAQLMERINLRQTVEGEWERSWPKIPLERAITELRNRLPDFRVGPQTPVLPGIPSVCGYEMSPTTAVTEIALGRQFDTFPFSHGKCA
jgi:Glycosyl transferase family 2